LTHYRQLTDAEFDQITYCFNDADMSDEQMKFTEALEDMYPGKMIVNRGMPNLQSIQAEAVTGHRLLVIDDLASIALEDENFRDFYFVWSHHNQVSIIFCNQNIFTKSKFGIDITRNSTHMVTVNSRSDVLSLDNISRRFYNNSKFLRKCFDHMRQWPEHLQQGYIVIDLSWQQTSKVPDAFTVFTNIFPIKEYDNETYPIFLQMSERRAK
jgi:hypothetical protein